MAVLAVSILVAIALLGRRHLSRGASARLGRAAFWLCNVFAAGLVVVLGSIALRGAGQAGIELLFLPLYAGFGAAVVLLGMLLQRILDGKLMH